MHTHRMTTVDHTYEIVTMNDPKATHLFNHQGVVNELNNDGHRECKNEENVVSSEAFGLSKDFVLRRTDVDSTV